MTSTIAIIGGSGLDDFEAFAPEPIKLATPYGQHASGVKQGLLNGVDCVFLPRHGQHHEQPPHKVNYRANIHLLKQLGVRSIIAINVVGGITEAMKPKALVIPDQIIDYSHTREQTFFDGLDYGDRFTQGTRVEHIDFTYPYSPHLREQLLKFFADEQIDAVTRGVYGCTQGPRLESAAEIQRLGQDGCDIVGMTAMPEAALARELGIDYVSLCLVVNWGAGIVEETLKIEDIMQTCAEGMVQIKGLLPNLCAHLA